MYILIWEMVIHWLYHIDHWMNFIIIIIIIIIKYIYRAHFSRMPQMH